MSNPIKTGDYPPKTTLEDSMRDSAKKNKKVHDNHLKRCCFLTTYRGCIILANTFPKRNDNLLSCGGPSVWGGSGNLSQESKKSLHIGYKGANIPYKSLKFDCWMVGQKIHTNIYHIVIVIVEETKVERIALIQVESLFIPSN